MKKVIDPSTQYLVGPNSRGAELKFSLKVMWQLIRGFRKLHFIGPCITVFGSARFNESHPYYVCARKIGKAIAELGFTTMTGGGPGIMEAANRGAFESKGNSAGCTIRLPHEQVSNPYMLQCVHFDYFFIRKVLLLKYSYAFIVMPGGFGTLDELFETLTLIQTGIVQNFPVVIIGKEYFTDVRELMDQMLIEETISPEDQDLILFCDLAEEAIEHIQNYISKNYTVAPKKALWWLGEN